MQSETSLGLQIAPPLPYSSERSRFDKLHLWGPLWCMEAKKRKAFSLIVTLLLLPFLCDSRAEKKSTFLLSSPPPNPCSEDDLLYSAAAVLLFCLLCLAPVFPSTYYGKTNGRQYRNEELRGGKSVCRWKGGWKNLLLGPPCKLQLQKEAKYFSDGKIKGIQMIFLL